MNKLEGNTATLVLSNSHSLTIKIGHNGDFLYYQWNGGNDNTIYEAEIDYYEDNENLTGYAEDEENLMQAGFKTEEGQLYFLAQFMRDRF